MISINKRNQRIREQRHQILCANKFPYEKPSHAAKGIEAAMEKGFRVHDRFPCVFKCPVCGFFHWGNLQPSKFDDYVTEIEVKLNSPLVQGQQVLFHMHDGQVVYSSFVNDLKLYKRARFGEYLLPTSKSLKGARYRQNRKKRG